LNEREQLESVHQAVILFGSNIEPVNNLRQAVIELRKLVKVVQCSATWETQAAGDDGPNFLNLAASIETELDAGELKNNVLTRIEAQLGRQRSLNKNAPRTIDLDIIIFDGALIDPHIWERVYLALTVSELFPGLRHAQTGKSLREVAEELSQENFALKRDDLEM